MSIRIMTRVWDARGLPSPAVRLVLLKLADCANDAGERAFPSVETIAHDCEISDRQVQRALRWLDQQHYIARVASAQYHRPAEWAVTLDVDGRPYARTAPVDDAPRQGRHPVTPRVRRQGRHPVTPSTPSGVTSTTGRGDIDDVALYVPRSVQEPSVLAPVVETTPALVASTLPAHPIKALLTEHERLFRKYLGDVPPHYTGKDAKIASQLIAQHGYDEVVAMLPRLFESADPFIRQSGRDMAILSACWNKLVVQAQPTAQLSESTTRTLAAGARWLAKQKGGVV